METVTGKRTWDLVSEAFLSDEDPGYPNDCCFIASDEEWADEAVWRHLAQEHRPVVLVGEKDELVLIPKRKSVVDRVRGTVRVTVSIRVGGRPAEFVTSSRLDRQSVREIRATAPLALSH